jgi:hypothetical protein
MSDRKNRCVPERLRNQRRRVQLDRVDIETLCQRRKRVGGDVKRARRVGRPIKRQSRFVQAQARECGDPAPLLGRHARPENGDLNLDPATREGP